MLKLQQVGGHEQHLLLAKAGNPRLVAEYPYIHDTLGEEQAGRILEMTFFYRDKDDGNGIPMPAQIG